MSFSLWALAWEAVRQTKGLRRALAGHAWMHPQSMGDPVVGLHSRGALSPVPRQEHEAAIVLEDARMRGSRRFPRARRLIGAIRVIAAKAAVKTRLLSRRETQTAFWPSGVATKYQMSAAIDVRLPELAGCLSPPRKPWMREDYRINIFDAVAHILRSQGKTAARQLA